MKRLAALVLGAGAAVAQAACPPTTDDGALLTAGAVQLAWRTEPAAVRVGQPFVLWVAPCPAGAVLAAVDATMPEHGHGMNYKPRLQRQADGRWRVDGLLWHMAGRWELRFDVRNGGETVVLRQSVLLK